MLIVFENNVLDVSMLFLYRPFGGLLFQMILIDYFPSFFNSQDELTENIKMCNYNYNINVNKLYY